MEPSIDDLRRNYKNYSDDQLIRLATSDLDGMRSEAIAVMKEEIKSRNLNMDLMGGIEIQQKGLDDTQIALFCNILQRLPCPVCNSTHVALNAASIETVQSFVFFTNKKEQTIIACPACLKKINNRATRITSVTGWWGFPSGIIATVTAIGNNLSMKKVYTLNRPSKILEQFVIENASKIKAFEHDTAWLKGLISQL